MNRRTEVTRAEGRLASEQEYSEVAVEVELIYNGLITVRVSNN